MLVPRSAMVMYPPNVQIRELSATERSLFDEMARVILRSCSSRNPKPVYAMLGVPGNRWYPSSARRRRLKFESQYQMSGFASWDGLGRSGAD